MNKQFIQRGVIMANKNICEQLLNSTINQIKAKGNNNDTSLKSARTAKMRKAFKNECW